jgi:CubicO group peptidase (beta-lactamase class C family)
VTEPGALASISDWSLDWGVPNAAALVRSASGVLESHGETSRPFRLASVSKLLTAYAVMVAVEEEALGLDDPAGPPGATVRHLLAHTAGYGFESGSGTIGPPGSRRTYSNQGIEVLAAHLAEVTEIPFSTYLAEAVLEPLGMTATELRGSPAYAIWSTADDLSAFAAELLRPRILAPETLTQMRAIQFPGLSGVLPGVGRFDPLDWGLGFERNFGRPGHWAGPAPSRDTYGHFGGAGTFLWADPAAGIACLCLTDLDFDQWALQAWPPLCTAVLAAHS